MFVAEAGVGVDLELDGELEGVEQRVGGEAVDARVQEGVLYFHDGEHDGFAAFEDGEFNPGVLVEPDGAAESGTTAFATIPLIVEVAEGLVTEGGGAAFYAVSFDVGAGTTSRHERSFRNSQS